MTTPAGEAPASSARRPTLDAAADHPPPRVAAAREHWVNADFDRSLAGAAQAGAAQAGASQAGAAQAGAAQAVQVRELRLHTFLIGAPGDSVLVPEPIPDAHLAYLARHGVVAPEPLPEDRPAPQRTFTPFGWNAAASERNRGYQHPSPHPPLEVVRRVNGRLFAHRIARDELGDRVWRGSATALPELEELLRRQGPSDDGWVVKAEHGNAALASRRLRRRSLDEEDRVAARDLLALGGRLHLERWCPRLRDFGTRFDLGPSGVLAGLRHHEVVNTASGSFVGAMNGGELEDPWLDALDDAARRAGSHLHRAGYFGPVAIDAYLWSDGGVPRLRCLVDLNARQRVSALLDRLRDDLPAPRVLYWRLFPTRRLTLPRHYPELERALGPEGWEVGASSGVLVTSPLTVESQRPRRLGALFVAGSRAEILDAESRFRQRWERR